MGEVRSELRRKIGTGNNAQVDLVPEFGKDARRRVADPVTAGFVDPRLSADVLLDDARQLYELFALEFKWQDKIALAGDVGPGGEGLGAAGPEVSAVS
jgi:hypothetical protein